MASTTSSFGRSIYHLRCASRGSRRAISQTRIRLYSAAPDSSIPPEKQRYVPTAGTYPLAFRAASTHVGVKESNTRFDDLALIASDIPCSAAAVFTKNKFQAAPVTYDRDLLTTRGGHGIRAIIINSGCANAVTGRGGLQDARKMGEQTDRCLPDLGNIGVEEGSPSSLVMSTGVIGQRLPISKILSKIPLAISSLDRSHDNWLAAARAICTTDTFPKLRSRTFTLPSFPETTFTVTGMTKGAGMIHPNMATLLGIICTDAPIAPEACQSLLTHSVERSFNSISIDGDSSTNDTVALLANGAASRPSSAIVTESRDYASLQQELTSLTKELAQLVVRDGEGATKFVTIRVRPGEHSSRTVAHRIASSVARSPLVKTALYGRDANWGRILCAIGYTEGLMEGDIQPTKVSVSFIGRRAGATEVLHLLLCGEPQVVDEIKASKMLAEEDLEVLIQLNDRNEGESFDPESCEEDVLFWTCDFSHEYVTINGDYRT